MIDAAQTEFNFKKRGTSSEAAAGVAKTSAYWREQVKLALAYMGEAAPHDIADYFQVDVTTIRPRCTELLKLGAIRETGARSKTPAGRSAAVLRLATPQEREAWQS